MSKCVRFLSLLLPLILLACFFSNAASADEVSRQKYVNTLDFLSEMGQDIYCYWDLKKEMSAVDWQKIISQAKQEVSHSTTETEFRNILTRVGAAVKDGHVNYNGYNRISRIYHTKNRLADIRGKVVVTLSNAEQTPELQIGDQILQIEGVSVEQKIAELSKYVSGSTAIMIRTGAIRRLLSRPYFIGNPGETVNLQVARPGVSAPVEVILKWKNFDWDPANQSKKDTTAKTLVKSRVLSQNIGYISIDGMWASDGTQKLIQAAHTELDKLMHTDALIIDVRRNGGGDGAVGDSINGRFIDRQVTRYMGSFRVSKQVYFSRPETLFWFLQGSPLNYGGYTPWRDVFMQPGSVEKRYSKPVFILTGPNCYSACDTFVDSFQANRLGEVLGQQTGGGTGYPLAVSLPYKLGSFRFSTLRGYSVHGRFLEGTGTFPDLAILPSLNSVIARTDSQLTDAHSYVVEKIGGGQILSFTQIKSRPLNASLPAVVEEELWNRTREKK